MFHITGDRIGRGRAGRTFTLGLVSINFYTSSQTLIVPKGATKAWVRLVGGGGGKGSNNAGSQAAGGGGYLEKFLANLVPGGTLGLTIGAGGTGAGGGTGGNTTLASGTLPITTLTASGGAGVNGSGQEGNGGTATNGDINITGGNGLAFTALCLAGGDALGGGTAITPHTSAQGTQKAGTFPGGGAAVTATTCAQFSGAAGVASIWWFS